MRRLNNISLVSTLTYFFSFLTVLLCLSFVILFYYSYYFFADQELKNSLTQTAQQLNSEYFIYDNNEIKYLQSDNKVSITDLLRSRDQSAVIFDAGGKRIGTFGIYRVVYDSQLSNLEEDNAQKINFKPSSEMLFSHLSISDLTYETYTTPILYEQNIIGYIQIAKQYTSIQRIKSLSFTLIVLVLPPSLILIWLLTSTIIKKFISPFERLSKIFSVMSVDSFPTQVNTQSRFSEIQMLVSASNAMIERLRGGIEAQKHFIAYASHEIKTPLTRVVSSLEILEQQNQSSLVSRSVTDLYNISKLLDGLLLLLLPKKSFESSQCNGSKILENYVFSNVKKRNNLDLKTNIEDNIFISMHPSHFEMLVGNIINNADKYTKSGKIVITLRKIKAGFEFVVSDTGAGISQDQIDLILTPFFRSTQSLTIPGLGVGLNLVKQICDYCSFSLDISSKEGQGTIISVRSKI